MSLSSVIQIAQNSLSNMTTRTSVLARNINEAGNSDYARREVQTISLSPGAGSASIRRITNLRLESALAGAVSVNSGQQVHSSLVDTLSGLLAGDDGELNVSAQLTALQSSLQTYSANPENALLASAVLSNAKEMVSGLNDATRTIQDFRLNVDKDIAQAGDDLNSMLSEFKVLNDSIRQGTQTCTDVNDALDRRTAVLSQISQIVPVSSFVRSNNDMVLVTASGAMLFETAPRTFSFTAQTALAPGTSGNPVYVDVIKLAVPNSNSASASGSLEALFRLRDTLAPTLQKQMDELARSLISVFSETDVTGGALAPMQGLFARSGGPAFPTAGLVSNGLAGDIIINPAYDPESGGNIFRLRDGGANGAAYLSNPSGAVSYSERLIGLSTGFDAGQPYDVSAGLAAQASLSAFSVQSSGWLAGLKSESAQSAIKAEAKYAMLSESLSNTKGVNIDTEMARLGEFEQAYQASARLLKAADQMLQDLLDAVG